MMKRNKRKINVAVKESFKNIKKNCCFANSLRTKQNLKNWDTCFEFKEHKCAKRLKS